MKFEDYKQLVEEYERDMDKLVEECPNETKLAVTRWVLKHLANHYKDGNGSYRYLIYDRLGFGPEAYAPLLDDGMFLSNEFFDIQEKVVTKDGNNQI